MTHFRFCPQCGHALVPNPAVAEAHRDGVQGHVATSQVILDPAGRSVVATLHPSAILRSPDPASQKELLAALVSDLILAGQTAGEA